MTIHHLPCEIAQIYMQQLSANDLRAYSRTCRDAMTLCTDSWFWKTKVRTTARRVLQNDWFCQLARLGAHTLMLCLCKALKKENLCYRINEHALIQSLVWLKKQDTHTQQKIGSMLIQRFFRSVTKSRYNLKDRLLFYFGKENSNVCSYDEGLTLETLIVFQTFNDTNDLFYWHPVSHSFVLRQEERQNILNMLDNWLTGGLNEISSPSIYLAQIVHEKDNKRALNYLITLEELILPLYMNMDAIADLSVYMRDITARRRIINQRLAQLGDYDDIRDRFFRLAINECTLKTFNKLVNRANWINDITVYNHLYREKELYYCRDVNLYKEIAVATNYQPNILIAGYSCMEPQEWLEWLKNTPLDGQTKKALIEKTKMISRREGYTYFASKLTSHN